MGNRLPRHIHGLVPQAAVKLLDDVVVRAKVHQLLLEVGFKLPLRSLYLLGQFHALQPLQAPITSGLSDLRQPICASGDTSMTCFSSMLRSMVRSKDVNRSACTSFSRACSISLSVRSPSRSVAASDALCRMP